MQAATPSATPQTHNVSLQDSHDTSTADPRISTADGSITEHDWSTFTAPPSLPVSHPHLARFHPSSAFLRPRNIASNFLNTTLTGTFGNPSHPIAFSIGNGGAGYTGILKPLCAKFIWTHGNDFRIGWVSNHSRFSQVALLGGVVQVSLSYEPEWEERMEEEGWGRIVGEKCVGGNRVVGHGRHVFWDHFVLIGPKDDPAGLRELGGGDVRASLRKIANGGDGVKFFTRGDGSATFNKEQQFWRDLDLNVAEIDCIETHASPPYKALANADEGGAYMLSDRSTYLTAKRDGLILNLRVYVEGGKDMLNPCSVSINTKVTDDVGQRLAVRFAEWLRESNAQGIFSGYGRVWEIGLPLFTSKEREEFADEEGLVGRDL